MLVPLIVGSLLSIGWILYGQSMSPGLLMSRIFLYQRAMIPWELLSQRDIDLLFIGPVRLFLPSYLEVLHRQSA